MHARPKRSACATVALGCLLAGCTGGSASHSAASAPCPRVAPAEDTSALPRALDLESLATVTEVVRQDGFVNATAVTDGTLSGVQDRFSRVLRRAGYEIVGAENEVVEADIFFARGQATTGGVKLVQTACDGRVRVQLFIGRTP